MSLVPRQEIAKNILGEHFMVVTDLMQGNTPAERTAGLRAAAKYVERNAQAVVQNPDSAQEILKTLRTTANELGVRDIEASLSLLQKELVSEKPSETPSDDSTEQAESEEIQSPEEIQDRAEHLVEVLGMYLDDVKLGNRGSVFSAAKKLPQWKEEVQNWPANLSSDQNVRTVQSLLTGLENALASQKIQ